VPKILILVLSSNTYPSSRNEKTIKKTWFKDVLEDVEVIFYKAGKESKLLGKELILDVGTKTSDIGLKTIEAFEWSLNNLEFDFLLRTNTSSYINIQNLVDYINTNFSKDKFLYHGLEMKLKDNKTKKEINFVSGSGILFNLNTIKLIVNNKTELDYKEWDDVAIGKLLKKFNVNPTSGFRYDIKGNIFKQSIDKSYYHYRCRIDNHYGYPRYLEKYVLKELHNIMKQIKVNKFTKYILNLLFEFSKLFYIQYPYWKLYIFLKKALKKILPNKAFAFLKEKLQSFDYLIKLRYIKK